MTGRVAVVVVSALAALSGGIWSATASAASLATVATVQAEQMQLPVGAQVISDRSASGGEAVEMTSAGSSLSSALVLPSTATSLKLVVHGARCQRAWPMMTVSLDGHAVISNATVSSTSWQTDTAAVSLPAGNHTLSITDSSASCSTLYVDEAAFSGPPPPAPTVALTATPTSITAGGSSSLTWSATGATSCTASGGWNGSEPTSGTASTGALLASTTYGLRCTGAGGSTSASATVTVTPVPVPVTSQVCQSVAVPAYFYPTAGGPWSAADAAEPGLGIMIANVANGPGTTVNSDYATAIANARAAGIQVFGYVYTSYGSLSLKTVEANITAWKTLYGVTSIFLDEASTSSSELSYYESLSSFVHAEAAGAQTIVNFGTIPSQNEMNAGDIVVTFEGDYSTYLATGFPSWTKGFAASRFYNIVYDVPDQASMSAVLTQAASDNVGNVYATSDLLPNPYDTLPSYLSAEATQAHSGC